MGWYLNGCACGEHHEHKINYEGDIAALHAFNFDGVKIDGCGAQRNNTLHVKGSRWPTYPNDLSRGHGSMHR